MEFEKIKVANPVVEMDGNCSNINSIIRFRLFDRLLDLLIDWSRRDGFSVIGLIVCLFIWVIVSEILKVDSFLWTQETK